MKNFISLRKHLLLFSLLLVIFNLSGQTQLGDVITGELFGDVSGNSVSISSDGSRIAIGAPANDGTGGPEDRNGHVRVYEWTGSSWIQVGEDIDGESIGGSSGSAVSLSSNGNRVATGAPNANSNGEVKVYEWNGSFWIQVGDNIAGEPLERFGASISISSDGNRLACSSIGGVNFGQIRIYDWIGGSWVQVGQSINKPVSQGQISLSPNGDRIAIGVSNGNNEAGYAQIYKWSGSAWTQMGSDVDGELGDELGNSISMSSENRVAIGAPYSNMGTGHVQIHEWNGSSWIQVGEKIEGEMVGDVCSYYQGVSISHDGNIIAVGALGHSYIRGQVRLFEWNGNAWIQIGEEIIGVPKDYLGQSVSLSGEGERVVIGIPGGFGFAGQTKVYDICTETTPNCGPCSVSPPLNGWLSSICQEEINFSVTTDGFTSPLGYLWDFGDGTMMPGPSTISHTYLEPGNYTVCVTASNMACSANYCQDISFANPPPVFDTQPVAITLEANDLDACTNDEYIPNLTATDPCDFNFPTPVLITYCRNDGEEISAPWSEGITTVTAKATGSGGATTEISWNVEVLECEIPCADETMGTFSTYFENDNNNSETLSMFQDVLAASNGEYISIGYDFTKVNSKLIFQRQDIEGNTISSFLDYTIEPELLYSARFSPRNLLIKDAFIEEAFDPNGVSVGYYIATSVVYTSISGNSYDALLILVDHSGNEIWTEHVNIPVTHEAVRGITFMPNGVPALVLDQSNPFGEENHHLGIWVQGTITLFEFPLDDIATGENEFYPTCVSKVKSNLVDAYFAIGGQWKIDDEEFIGVYLLAPNLEVSGTIIYDLMTNTNVEFVLPTSISSSDDTIAVHGYHEIIADEPASFGISFVPNNSIGGGLLNNVLWAKEYYYPTGSLFSDGIVLTDSKKDGAANHISTGVFLINEDTDVPFLMKTNSAGELQFINSYVEDPTLGDIGKTPYLGGLDFTLDDGYFVHSSFFNEQGGRTRMWTAKLDEFGGLDNCDCLENISVLVQDLNPEYFISNFGERSFNQFQLSTPNSEIAVIDYVSSFCAPFNSNEFCGEPECAGDTLILNTGYDPINDILNPIGSYNPAWNLTTAPVFGLNLPIPANIISPFELWRNQENTEWISAYPSMITNETNPAPELPYTFQNCFCTCGDSTDLNISLSVYADDEVTINLVDVNNNLIETLITHNGPNNSPGQINTNLSLPEGNYCISAELRNLSGITMGLNINGFITGASILDAACCGTGNGTIVGTKYRDRNCSGTRDNPDNPDQANHEEGLEGWEITLFDINNIAIATTVTDQFGNYVFNEVVPGLYTVKETQQLNWEATNAISSTGYQISVENNEIVSEINFANKYNGPVEILTNLDCVVPGEAVAIQWDGPDCDCDITISHISCGSVSVTQLIETIPSNEGGYTWVVPDDLLFDAYQIYLEACNGSESTSGECFEVNEFELNLEAINTGCGGEVFFSANSNAQSQYTWDFGDGFSAEGFSVSHIYDILDTYEVNVSAVSINGCSQSEIIVVTPSEDETAPRCLDEEILIIAGDLNLGGAMVDFDAPIVIDDCSTNLSTVCDPVSGSFFPCGSTEVICTITDEAGNSAECVKIVEVNCDSFCTAEFSWTNVACYNDELYIVSEYFESEDSVIWTFGNYVSEGATIADPLSIFTFFESGTYTVCAVVFNATCSVEICEDIIIEEEQGPEFITCFETVTEVVNPENCEANYDFFLEFYDPCLPDNDTIQLNPGDEIVGYDIVWNRNDNLPITAPFQIGTTSISVEISNGVGSDYCDWRFTLLDETPPVFLECPTNISAQANVGDTSTFILITLPTAIDNCPNVTVECDFFDDQSWPCGETIATCIATDVSGNADTCTFRVTVTCEDTICQSPSFLKLYGDDINNFTTKIEQHDNSLFALGYRTTFDPNVSGTFTKLNLDGSIVWNVQLPSSYRIYDFIKSEDGFILVGGRRPFDDTANSLICKIDLSGNLSWSKEYNFANRESLTRIVPANDPGSLVMEYYILGIINGAQGDQILLKIDEDGTELFNKQLNFTDDQLQSDFFRLSNGDYLMLGSWGNGAQLGRISADGLSASYSNDGSSGHKLFDGVEANGKVYLVGQTASNGYLLVLNSTGTEKIARYTLPEISAAFQIQADGNGNLYLSGASNDPTSFFNPLIYKLTESFSNGTATDLSIEWVKSIENNESPFGSANITITDDQKLIYADNRFNAPGGFGDYDVLMGVFDLNMGGLCLIDSFNHSISEPILISENINAAFTITDQPFPTPTSFSLFTEFEYLCTPVECEPVPCNTELCQEFIVFMNCPSFISLPPSPDECEAFFDCSTIIAIDTCTNEEVSVNCTRSDGLNSDAPFPFGDTQVIASAFNNSTGEFISCEIIVRVEDGLTPVIITCPVDTTFCALPNGNFFSFAMPVFNDNCTDEAELAIICSHQPGDLFPVGTTSVTCTATDLYGNISEPCVFEVIVEECPANCCEDIGSFNERFDQGFTVSNDGCNLFILPTGLEDCDIVTVDWGDDFSDTGAGSELLSHNYGSNLSNEYTITYQVLLFEEDGSVCGSRDSVFIVCIECTDCENPTLEKVWTKSIGDYDRNIIGSIGPPLATGNAYNFMGLATNGSDVFVSGNFLNTAEFTSTLSGTSISLTSNGMADLFFAKFNSNGDLVEALSAGGSLRELATEIELDAAGNIYIGGSFESESLTLPSTSVNTIPPLLNSNPGDNDIFIAKYNSAFELIWAKSYGTIGGETIWDMTVSDAGDIGICGRYFNHPLDFGSNILPPGNINAGYVTKFDTHGTPLWAFELRSPAPEDFDGRVEVTALDFDQSGNLYVASAFGGELNIDPIGGSTMLYNCSDGDACKHAIIAQYDSSNGHLNWHQVIGEESEDNTVVPHSIAVHEGKIYLSGVIISPEENINFAAAGQTDIIITLNGSYNSFLATFDATAGNCDWAHIFNTNGRTLGVGVDNEGNPAIVGGFFSSGSGTDFDPDPNSSFLLNSSSLDGYMAKFNVEGEFITAFNLLGSSIYGEGLHEVVFDNENNLITIGFHGSSDLDDDPSPDNTTFLDAHEIEDIFIGKYSCSCSPVEGTCCEEPSSFIVAAESPELDDCCFALNIQNDFGVSMTSMELQLNTDGWNIDQSIVANGYQILSASDGLISITHSSGIIPGGFQEGVISFCLNTLDESPAPEQQIEVVWMSPAYPTDSLGQMYCNDLHSVSSTCNDLPCIDFMSSAEPTCLEGSFNEYEFNFSITNRGLVDASAIVLNSQHPNFTMIDCNSPLNTSYANITLPLPGNLAPGATSENLCISIISAEPLSEITELCLTASLEGTGTELCCIETTPYCLTIEPCCTPCESGSVVSEPMISDTTGCCHQLDISNDCYPDFFTRLELEILTDGVQFSNLQNGDPENWNFSLPDNTNTIVNWNPNGGFIPTDNYEDLISFCLGGIEVEAETQQVLLSWYINDPNSASGEEIIFCSETLDYQCEVFDDLNCATVWYDSISCDTTTGIYELIFSVENTSIPEFDMELVQLIWTQEIAFVSPNPIVVSSTSPNFEQLQPGEIGQYTVQIVPNTFPFPESSFEFELLFKDDFGVACCNKFEHLSVPLPNCTDSNNGNIGVGITVFPNPFSDQFAILFEQPVAESFQLKLFDIYGRVLRNKIINRGTTELTIEAKDLSAGIYFLELVDAKGQRQIEKLINH